MSTSEIVDEVRRAIWHLRQGGPQQVIEWQRRRAGSAIGDSRLHAAQPATPAISAADSTSVENEQGITRIKTNLDFPEFHARGVGPRRADVTAAVIMDDFSAGAFAREWNIIRISRSGWLEQIRDREVDLLLVESAWHGNNDEWATLIGKHAKQAPELMEVVTWCRASGIPTVFWNKEDPPHFATFIGTAKLFDHVLTTDSEKIPSYQRDLGHKSVTVMPFAAQTEIHTPARNGIERGIRDVAFGGMYFQHKYKERRDQMDLLLGGAIDAEAKTGSRLEVFSRYLGSDEKYQFPGELGERVVGSLPYEKMLSAYRAYKLFLNVNTVTNSPTMCARRLFEIPACGTPVVTTPSKAVGEYFASDEILVADSRKQAENLVRTMLNSPELRDRTVHRAQRRIWDQHTYAHRAEAILDLAAPEIHRPISKPAVSILAPTKRPHQIEHILEMVASQRGLEKQLVLLTHGFSVSPDRLDRWRKNYDFDILYAEQTMDNSLGEILNNGVRMADGDVLSKMDDDDFYAPEYLADLVRALFFSRAELVGKGAHFMHLAERDMVLLRQPELEHRYVQRVIGPTLTGNREVFIAHPFADRTRGEDSQFMDDLVNAGGSIYATDRFNFCQMRGGADHTWAVHDQAFLATGRVETFGDPEPHVTV